MPDDESQDRHPAFRLYEGANQKPEIQETGSRQYAHSEFDVGRSALNVERFLLRWPVFPLKHRARRSPLLRVVQVYPRLDIVAIAKTRFFLRLGEFLARLISPATLS